MDGAAVEGEALEVASRLRHRVGDEEYPAFARRQCDADGGGVDVDAVGDQPRVDARMIEHGPDEARIAVADLAHGIEQVRRHRGAGPERGGGDIVARIGVADADHDAGRDEPRDLLGRDGLGGDREQQVRQQPPRVLVAHEVALGHRPNVVRVVGALARNTQVRALEMKAEEAGDGPLRGFGAGDQHRVRHRLDVGDEGGEDRRRAEAGVDRADIGEIGHGRARADQVTAATIDLEVDEAGRECATVDLDDRRTIRDGADAVDDPVANDERSVIVPGVAVE